MSLPIADTLVPGGTGFGITNDSDQVGGFAVETSEATIGALAGAKLKVGMQRYSLATGITYVLTSTTPGTGFANGTWVATTAPSSGGQWTAANLVATTNITLSGEQTIDGVMTSSARVLVVGQTTASQNGIYTTGTGAWTRTSDANTSGAFVAGKTIAIIAGTTNANSIWLYNGPASPTIGTSTISFGQNSASNGGAGTVTLAGSVTGASNATKVVQIDGSSSTGALPIPAKSSTWTPSANLTQSVTEAEVQTTNATATTLALIATTAGKAYRVDVQVGTALNGSNDYVSNTHAAAFSNVSGTLAQGGTTLNGTAVGSTAGKTWPGLTIGVSGTNIIVQVTGAASTAINWRAIIRVTQL